MKYSQAKAKATELTYIRKIDHAIVFDGVSYSVEMLPKFTGTCFEIVRYSKKNKSNAVIAKPNTTKKKKTSNIGKGI